MNPSEGGEQARLTAEAVARESYGKLVAFLAVRTGDVAAAEDALSEAFAAALTDWPVKGCPKNPGAWLLTVARRKSIDVLRGKRRHEAASEEFEAAAAILQSAPLEAEIPDERLAMMFACAHPAIEAGIRAPLILQAVLGLDAARIASAFLMSPAAMSKRLVRAKVKIRQTAIPFRVPERTELPARLDSILNAIYAAFSEGWTDPGGVDAARRDLTQEAIFLARLVAGLLPNEAEALGLLALLLYADARRRARRSADGEFVPLAEQDTALWDGRRLPRLRRCCGAPAHWVRLGDFNWRRRCSRRMWIGAGAGARIGLTWWSFTMGCLRWRVRQWWPSIALWRLRR